MTPETRRSVRIFLNGGLFTTGLLVATIAGTLWYERTVRAPALDAAFEAEMQAHAAFLAEHERRMAAYAQDWETRTQPQPEAQSPCP